MKEIKLDSLYNFIKESSNPVHELSLLNRFFPETPIKIDDIGFFRAHFNLYHYLYKLQSDLDREGKEFLYIMLASCYLLPLPPEDKCRHFYEEKHDFCHEPVHGNGYCTTHYHINEQIKKSGTAASGGVKSWYLDRKNYEEMNEESFQKISSSANAWLSYGSELEKSLNVMSLPWNFSLEKLKARYRYLVKKNHPDSGTNQDLAPEMKNCAISEINNAYKVLKGWKES